MKSKHALIALAILLSSCEFKCSIGKDNGVTTKEKPATKLSNDIQITDNNINVNQAYLSLETGNLIPSDNTVAVNQKIILTIISEGWKKVDGKSYIGIHQKISTNTGKVILDTDDLFAKYDATGIDAQYTGLLKLSAVITETPTDIDHFVTTFRIWDKKGDGEVKGSYKFFVK